MLFLPVDKLPETFFTSRRRITEDLQPMFFHISLGYKYLCIRRQLHDIPDCPQAFRSLVHQIPYDNKYILRIVLQLFKQPLHIFQMTVNVAHGDDALPRPGVNLLYDRIHNTSSSGSEIRYQSAQPRFSYCNTAAKILYPNSCGTFFLKITAAIANVTTAAKRICSKDSRFAALLLIII